MEKKSRFELIKLVEAQKEQLVRYETRFRGKEMFQAFKFTLCDSTTKQSDLYIVTFCNEI